MSSTIDIAEGRARPAARLGGRAGPAQGGPHRIDGDARSDGSQERHRDDPHRHDCRSRSCWYRAHREPRAPGRERHRGVRHAGLEIVAKQLELLKETVPKIRSVAILSNPANAYHQLAIREVNVAARSLGVQLQLLEARGPNEFDGAFAAMAKERVGALLVLSEVMLSSHGTRLADLAARSRLPAAYGIRESVEAGGLMSYGPSFLDLYRRSAAYVDKILKGAKPADLPWSSRRSSSW